ncbi:hypothetical protein [Bacillus sp. L27]|uniref:hypothetical protein n=1 Tax=Bacillus sp. L27 TaxID=1866312 RepID=UPI000B06145F|nr:hypothetical protein [Bacillus sp. L27]
MVGWNEKYVEVAAMEQLLKQTLNELQAVRKDIAEIKEMMELLQKNFNESFDACTERIIEHVNDKAEGLNKRVFTVETDVQRIGRQ